MSSDSGKGVLYFTDGTSLDGSYRIAKSRKGVNRLRFFSPDILNPALKKETDYFVSETGHFKINKLTIERVRSTSKKQVITCIYIPL